MDEPTVYQIVVQGELSERWFEWFDELDLALYQEPDGKPVAILCGPVPDQAALRGILCKLWDLNLTLVSVHPFEVRAGNVATMEEHRNE
jgi:hypothetical protein